MSQGDTRDGGEGAVGEGFCKETKTNKQTKNKKRHAVSWEHGIINNSSSGSSKNNSVITSFIILTNHVSAKENNRKKSKTKEK